MRKIIYILIAVLLVVWAGFKLSSNKKQMEEETAVVAQQNTEIPVRVTEVKKQILQDDYLADGNFLPVQQLNLSSERGGQVVRVLVEEGASVKKGQTLAVIKADLYSVELQNAEVAYQTALKDAERFENAFTTGGVTQQQLDQVKLQLQAAKARLDQAKINVGDAQIRATIDGIVNKKFIEPGTVVGPGTPLFEIVNVSTLKLKVNVNENQVAGIQVGDQVDVRASVYPDKKYTGKVTFVAPMADSSLNFPVEVEITNNADNLVRAGMYGTVIFSKAQENQVPVLSVPRNAFVGSVQSNQVFVVKGNQVELTSIVAGRSFGDRVEVIQGLQEGDVVVTSGIINLIDGAQVSIIE